MSCIVIRSNSNSAGLAINPTNFANLAAIAVAVAISISVTAFRLVFNLVDDLSLTLLTSAVLYSLNLGCSAHLLLIYISYSSSSFFYNETALVFLMYLAILRILYRPIKKQVRL